MTGQGSGTGGGASDGSIIEGSGGDLKGEIRVEVPAGVSTVQGLTAGSSGLSYTTPITLPSDFASKPFIRIETPLGVVNVRLNRIREISKG